MARRRPAAGRLPRDPRTGRHRDPGTGRFLPQRIVARRERDRARRLREEALRRLRARDRAREERLRRERETRPPTPTPRFRRGLRTPTIEETRRGVFRVPAGQPGAGRFISPEEARRRIAISEGVKAAYRERAAAATLPLAVDEAIRPPEVLLDPWTTFEFRAGGRRQRVGLGIVLEEVLTRAGALVRLARIGDRLVNVRGVFTLTVRLSAAGLARGLPTPPALPPVEVSVARVPARQVLDALLELWAGEFRGAFEFQMYQLFGQAFSMADLVFTLHRVQVEVTGA